ncbi:MAG: DUF1853 family protein [bacterium]
MSQQYPTDFKHECVRDLAWVIASPSLLTGEHHGDYCHVQYLDDAWWQTEYLDCLPALIALDREPKLLTQALAVRKTQRLGEHFECLVKCWLAISPNYRCLLHNYVLYEKKSSQRKTLGELDFIIQQKATGKIIHLEVAAKFYLARTTGRTLDDWYGANLNDQFSRKVAHIQQHQSQLAFHYADNVPYTLDESWVMLKGRLFYPRHLRLTEPSACNKPLNKPDNHHQCDKQYDGCSVNPNHLTGYWWFHQQIQAWDHLRRLPKRSWFAALSQTQLAHYYHSPQVSSNSTQAECYVNTQHNQDQYQRLFIVPDHHWARLNLAS